MNGKVGGVSRVVYYIWSVTNNDNQYCGPAGLYKTNISVTIVDDMVQVTRKDNNEANENIIRRFNRKVLQSGVLAEAKASMRFSKPLSKPERRVKAIIRKERKADKLAKARLGLR
jgi:ribosomal protein S21